MAMGIQQQQHQQQGEPPMFPGDFVEYGTQYDTSSDRQPRDGGRNGRFRRPRSPSLDDDSRFTTAAASTEPSEVAALHDAVLAQAPHQQQRVVPANQPGARTQARAAGPRSGPPSAANASQNRRSYPQPPHVQSNLPSYATGPDEWSPASREPLSAGASAAPNGGYSRRRTERHARRQSSTSGGAPGPGTSDPQMSGANSPRTAAAAHEASQNSPRVPSQTHAPQPSGALRAPSPPAVASALAGPNGNHLGLGDSAADISRLNSPSISKSVLEPLQRKMYEYHTLMEEAQGQMARLDDELRQLQERRHQAEQRFVDAKTKHDEYERQHLDVERALRGDYGPPMQQQHLQQQQQQQHQHQPMPQASQKQMYGNNSPPRTGVPARPASSLMSYDERPMSGRSSFQGKKGKFRISLFGR